MTPQTQQALLEAMECERCGSQATCYVAFTNVNQKKHPMCDFCLRQHEELANDTNQEEMRKFGGLYGFVTWEVYPIELPSEQAKQP